MAIDISSDIKFLAEKKGLSLLWIAEKIGMSKPGFYGMLNNNSIKVETLEKVALALNVPIIYFFSTEDSKQKILQGDGEQFWKNVAGVVAAGAMVLTYAATYLAINSLIKEHSEPNNVTKEDVIENLQKIIESMELALKTLSEHTDIKLSPISDFS